MNPLSSSFLQGLAGLLDVASACCFAKDLQGRYCYANAAVCTLFGKPLTEVLGRTDAAFFDPDASAAWLDNDRRVLQGGEERHAEEIVTLRSGEQRAFWTIKLPLRDAAGSVCGLIGIASDISASHRDAEQLMRRNEVLSTVLSNVDAYVYLKAHDGRYLYANPKVAALYGRSLAEILGRRDEELLPAQIAAALRQLDAAVLDSGGRVARQEMLIDTDQQERQFWSVKMPIQLPGAPRGLIGFSTDITELLALRQQLETQGRRDALTGLANRAHFEAELELDLAMARRDGLQLALVLLDLDQFKYINNSLGQPVGDQLLRQIAERLRGQCSAAGSVARLFGDAFAFSLPRFVSAEQVASAVEAVRAALAVPYRVDEHELHLTASAGIALYPEDGASCALLISRAETAMYHAKARGRNRQQFYAGAIGDAVSQRLALERDLRAAVAALDFELHYQPKRCADGRLNGFEALVRWRRQPDRALVSPALFIPLAEQTGLIDAIGAWVLDQACAQMAAWLAAGLGRVQVAVNLSPSQLRAPGLLTWLDGLRRAHGIADGQLELEVTESMMMDEPEQAIAALEALRRAGINLAIDDFGTGYSSMGYLKRIPVNTLKLDRVFVMHVDSDPRDADICAGMIALAHKLGLLVVAEGVETEAQRAALAERGCDVFQGYLFSRPLPAEQATQYLRDAAGG